MHDKEHTTNNIADRLPENIRRWRARRTSGLKHKKKRDRKYEKISPKFQKLF